jgi:hypothetical protein
MLQKQKQGSEILWPDFCRIFFSLLIQMHHVPIHLVTFLLPLSICFTRIEVIQGALDYYSVCLVCEANFFLLKICGRLAAPNSLA